MAAVELEARDLSEVEIEALDEGPPPQEDWFVVDGEIDLTLLKPPYNCPGPTRWRQTAQAVKTVGKWEVVSSAVYAKAAPVTHAFTVQRSITWGISVTESVKGSVKLVEAQLGITLDTQTTVTTRERLSYTVPKGQVMALFAAPGYVVRSFARTVYGSAMCNPVQQTCKVWSPYAHFLKVDRV